MVRPTVVRRTVGTVALGAIAVLGCDDLEKRTGVTLPGPSSGEAVVAVEVFGTGADPDGFSVVLGAEGKGEISSREVAPDGGTVLFDDLAPGAYSVTVKSVAAHCEVEGENPRSFSARGGESLWIEFALSCPGPDVSGVYRRTSPGSFSERFFLQEDAEFLLDYGPFGYEGSYSLAGQEIVFDFDGYSTAGEWVATATLHGRCMTVDYNPVMNLADFEDGEYCR